MIESKRGPDGRFPKGMSVPKGELSPKWNGGRKASRERFYALSRTPEYKAKRKIYLKTFKDKNPDYATMNSNRWRVNNPEKAAVNARKYSSARRARRKSSCLDDYKKAYGEILKKKTQRCFYCGKSTADFEIDHVVPLSKGGLHCAFNLVPSCKKCNANKRAKLPNDFIPVGQQSLLIFKQ